MTELNWVGAFEVHCTDLGAIFIVDHWQTAGEQPESVFKIRGAEAIRSCPEDDHRFLVERAGNLFVAYRIHQ